MKNFILFLTVLTFILEPMALMPKAQASQQQCQQGPEKVNQECVLDNSVGEAITMIGSFIQQDGGRRDGKQVQDQGQKTDAALKQRKVRCAQAEKECTSACDVYKGQLQAQKQSTQPAENPKKQCEETAQKAQEDMDGKSGELGKMLQALMGLLAALKGNKEDKKDEDLTKAEEDEEICDTPEGAFLVECQCEKNSEGKCIIEPKNTASRLGGSTFGAYAGAGVGGDVQARPADAEFESKLQEGAVGAASVGNNGGLGGPNGFGSSSSPASGGGVNPSADKAVNADISKGFHSASGGGGGGFGSFGGGGSKGGSYSGSFGGNVSAGPGEKAINKKLNRALSSRSPASVKKASTTGGPFGDNFFTIKNAYKKQKSSMYHHQQ